MPQDPLLTQYGRWTIQQRGISASQAPGCTSYCQNTTGTVGWENTRRQLVSSRKSPEIPYWWRGTTNQKRYPDLGTDASSVWNFCTRFSDVISRRNHRWRLEMSAVSLDCSRQLFNSAFFRINLHPLDSVIGFPNILRSLSQVCTWNYLHLEWTNLYLNDPYRNDSGSKRPVTRTPVVSIRYDLAQLLELLHQNISITSVE